MRCLSNPKMRLALIVNGLYFISLVTPTAPHTRPRLFSHARNAPYERDARVYTKTPPVEAPRLAPSKAAVYETTSRGEFDVYLTDDLTLVGGLSHTLMLSPTFNVTVEDPVPRSVLMRFISYSDEQHYDDAVPLVITADGQDVWDDTESARAGSLRPNSGRHSVTAGGGGQFIESVGVEIPYDIFARVAFARRVVIRLGDDGVVLRPEQIEALRDMHVNRPWRRTDYTPPPRGDSKSPSDVSVAPVIIQASPATPPPGRR